MLVLGEVWLGWPKIEPEFDCPCPDEPALLPLLPGEVVVEEELEDDELAA